MAEYYIGQIFENTYPAEAAEWVNDNNCYIDEIEPLGDVRRFEIFEVSPYVPTQEEIDQLTMTALDFVNFLKLAGLTDEQIELYLNTHLNVKHQLQFCQNVYCGVAKALMPISYEGITITAEMVEQAFRTKHGV